MANNARSNVERKAQKHEKKLAAQKAEQKKNRQHKAVVAAIVAVLLICLGLIIGMAVKENIDSGRGTVAASTQNFKVTQAMMNYFFNMANYFNNENESPTRNPRRATPHPACSESLPSTSSSNTSSARA